MLTCGHKFYVGRFWTRDAILEEQVGHIVVRLSESDSESDDDSDDDSDGSEDGSEGDTLWRVEDCEESDIVECGACREPWTKTMDNWLGCDACFR